METGESVVGETWFKVKLEIRTIAGRYSISEKSEMASHVWESPEPRKSFIILAFWQKFGYFWNEPV